MSYSVHGGGEMVYYSYRGFNPQAIIRENASAHQDSKIEMIIIIMTRTKYTIRDATKHFVCRNMDIRCQKKKIYIFHRTPGEGYKKCIEHRFPNEN